MLVVLWLCILLLCSHASNVLQGLQSNSEWWMLDNTTNANIYYRIEGKLIFLRHVMMDSRNIHSCYEYKVYDIDSQLIEKSRTFCYPAVFISGYKKCSTSALYMLMTQHSEVLRDHGKENCIFGNEGGSNVLGLFDTYPSSVDNGVVLVSGCIYWDRNYLMHEVLRHPNSFYIMIYRNYADFLWSAYNYWCSYPYDKNCRYEGQWLILRKFIRSPELFHEMVEGAVSLRNVSAPEIMQDCCRRGAVLFSNLTFNLWRSVRPENSLILSSEEMDVNPNKTWSRVAAAVGFKRHHRKITAFEKVKYNVNGAKGAFRPTDASKVVPGVYEISGFKPMLNSSRDMIDQCWAADGCFVSEVTQHKYSACDKLTRPSKYEAADEKNLAIYRSTTLNSSYAAINQFTKRKVKQCHDLNHSLSHSKLIARGSISFVVASKKNRKGLRVLLLSTSLVRRTMAKFLSLLLSSESVRISTVEPSQHKVKRSRDLLCGSGGEADGSDVTIITADPSEVSPGTGKGGVGLKFTNSDVCGSSSTAAVTFDKVIVLLDDQNDLLLLAWKLFKEESSYGDNERPEESIARFDWFSWSNNITGHIAALDKKTPKLGSEHVWSSAMRKAMNELQAEKRLILRMSDIRPDRGMNYINTLQRCSDFLQLQSPLTSVRALPLPQKIAMHESVDLLHCSSVLVAEGLPDSEREEQLHSLSESVLAGETRNLAVAYASSKEVCEVEKLLKDQPLELASLRRPYADRSKTHCELIEGEEQHVQQSQQDQYNQCVVRYKDAVRLTDESRRATVALLAQPGPESMSVRLLLQFSSGILTGGPLRYSEKYEGVGRVGCGAGLLITHIAPNEVLWFAHNQTLTSSVSMDNLRCNPQMSFSKAILLVSDPLFSLWRTSGASSSDSSGATLLQAAKRFSASQLTTFVATNNNVDVLKQSLKSLQTGDVLILSYEELVYSSLQGDATSLRRLYEFIGWQPLDDRRLSCLSHVMPRSADLKAALNSIAALEESAKKHKADYCEARRIVQQALGQDKIVILRSLLDRIC